MAKLYQAFPGMDDLLPGEIEKWQWIEERARLYLESRGCREIRTPLVEPTELFIRSIGEATDIVHKEMYTFTDRGGRSMTLRPEMTASVARAVLEHGLLKTSKTLRLYYAGPMFRAERPQAGRKRQFHQIGVELINVPAEAADREALYSLCGFLRYCGLSRFRVRLNDLSRTAEGGGAEGLRRYFSAESGRLCEDCRYRLERNVLRILDCKNSSCQPVIEKAPWEDLFPAGRAQALADELQSAGFEAAVDRRLVRGLDYYDGVVFEAVAEGLGSQDAVAGGGRYDRLYAGLGGAATPCTGFSVGVERLLTVLEAAQNPPAERLQARTVWVAAVENDPRVLDRCQRMALALRERGMKAAWDPDTFDLKTHLKRAVQARVRYALIQGGREAERDEWAVKDLERREQITVSSKRLEAALKSARLSGWLDEGMWISHLQKDHDHDADE
jgi:histidyl-tRNA synthetase